MIPYGRQSIDSEDVRAVCEVLQSPWLTQGPVTQAFELSLAEHVGAKHAVAVSSGTAGLHVACMALGLGNGDYLWTTPNSFVASANCGLYCGARVEFVDIDPLTRNMCVEKLAEQLAQAKAENVLPKIIVAVHFAGLPCDVKRIREIADYYGVYLIEDAAHAIGSQYLDAPVGSCHFSDITVFSFHPVKTLAAGEGGAVLTNDSQLASRIRLLATHGVERNSENWQSPPLSPCYYEQQQLGFNYRLSDIHAALALSQLKKLDTFVAARRNIVARYNKAFQDGRLQLPIEPEGYFSAWHIYVVTFDNSSTRDSCFSALKAEGIHVNVHYIPIPMQPFYQKQGFRVEDYPNAHGHYQKSLTLPLFVEFTEAQQTQVIDIVKGAL